MEKEIFSKFNFYGHITVYFDKENEKITVLKMLSPYDFLTTLHLFQSKTYPIKSITSSDDIDFELLFIDLKAEEIVKIAIDLCDKCEKHRDIRVPFPESLRKEVFAFLDKNKDAFDVIEQVNENFSDDKILEQLDRMKDQENSEKICCKLQKIRYADGLPVPEKYKDYYYFAEYYVEFCEEITPHFDKMIKKSAARLDKFLEKLSKIEEGNDAELEQLIEDTRYPKLAKKRKKKEKKLGKVS